MCTKYKTCYNHFLILISRQPIQKLCMLCLYYKMNDKTEIACCFQGNWNTQEILKENLKVGFIYNYTDSLTFGLKSNLSGNITTGVWYKTDGNIKNIYLEFVNTSERLLFYRI